MLKFFKLKQIRNKNVKGFILPYSLLLSLIILVISSGISMILIKELYFSILNRESQLAYYAADEGVMCATYIDDGFIDQSSGVGIFPYSQLSINTWINGIVMPSVNSQRSSKGLSSVDVRNIGCATSIPLISLSGTPTSIFVTNSDTLGGAYTSYTATDGSQGVASTFFLKMDLGNSTYRCAKVTVNKTDTFRQIISRGYNTCDMTSTRLLERAIISSPDF